MKSFDHQLLLAQATQPSGAAGNTEQVTAPVSETGTESKPAEASGQSSPGGGFSTLLFPVLLIAVFYFLLIRPQQKKEKNRQAMLKKLTKGDKVLNRGGIWGVVVGLKEDQGIAVVKIADNTKVEMAINSIEAVNPETGSEKADSGKGKSGKK